MSMVYEILTGDVDDANTEFTSSQIPERGSLHVFDDGVEVTVSSCTSTTITLAAAPATGSIVFAVYNVKPDELTAFDLIRDALMEIGVASREDEPDIKDLELGLRYLNRLVESNNICKSAMYTPRNDSYTLTANQAAYTIGVDPAGVLEADFDDVRPTSIRNIVLQLQSSPTVVRDRPMEELDHDQWARKQVREVYAIPKQYHLDEAYPLSTITFFPGPSSAYTVEIESWQQGARIANLYDAISYPPGYHDFWMYQLAVRLCGPFHAPITQNLIMMERRAIDKIVGVNSRAPLLDSDPALGRQESAGFNWRTGNY